ncbi:E3 ubiquitin-protein ligase TRIM32-like [Polypterus senegalus]|nr:E3 ubiquitin-protein ligase TRIM32-like [Polypterus senegalus]
MQTPHTHWRLSGVRKVLCNALLTEVGALGSGHGHFVWPTGLARMADGDLVVKDGGSERVQIFTRDGLFRHGFACSGASLGCLGNIAVTAHGCLLVSDGSKALRVFSKEGQLLCQLKSPKIDWRSSHGLAVLPADKLMVTDWTDGGKVHILSVDWRTNGVSHNNIIEGFCRPVQAALSKNEELLIVEGQLFGQYEGRCLKMIDPKKELKRKVGPELANGATFVNPSAVCVDADGNIFVADEGQSSVHIFNPDATLNALVVSSGLQGPTALCLTEQGYLAVADCYHRCVKVYRYR